MLSFLLRWGGLGAAALFAAASWSSWRTGEPPTWSILSPRVDARVIEARVESGVISNGTTRHWPVVLVDAGDGAEKLKGLQPTFFAHRQKQSEQIVARYRVGETVRVRDIDGVLMANRIDLFQTAHAVFTSLMTLIVAAIGAVMAVAAGKPRAPKD